MGRRTCCLLRLFRAPCQRLNGRDRFWRRLWSVLAVLVLFTIFFYWWKGISLALFYFLLAVLQGFCQLRDVWVDWKYPEIQEEGRREREWSPLRVLGIPYRELDRRESCGSSFGSDLLCLVPLLAVYCWWQGADAAIMALIVAVVTTVYAMRDSWKRGGGPAPSGTEQDWI